MSLDLINIKTNGSNKYLLPFSYQRNWPFPTIKNDTVYFSATSGIDDRVFAPKSIKPNKLYELKDF